MVRLLRGGTSGKGTVFKINSVGQIANVFSFTGGDDGANPRASLIAGMEGNFYGSTFAGGNYGNGTIFALSPEGVVTTLYQFDGFNGANPRSAMTQGADGFLYGTTENGGAGGSGVVFRLGITALPQITAQPLGQSVFAGADVQFSVAVFGGQPLFYQWQKDGFNLSDGGIVSNSAGRVLSLRNVSATEVGSYSVVVSNSFGFASSLGAFLAVTSSAPYIVVQPTNQTLAAGARALLGVTVLGNLPLKYQWRKNGTNLVDGGNTSGSGTATLSITGATVANNGNYSVAVSNALGAVTSSTASLSVVALSSEGTALSTLHWFGTNTGGGQTPNGLMLASNGNLYGTTQAGSAASATGFGTVFKISTNGLFSTLLSFSGSNGFFSGNTPLCSLSQDTNGNFYGTTAYGGTNALGNIYKLSAENSFTDLYSFVGGNDGSAPSAPLILSADGTLRGVTASGGAYGQGNIFSLSPGGAFSNRYSFTGAGDGSAPVGALLQGLDSNFYGMTASGGSSNRGTVFRTTATGVTTNIYSFTGGSDGFLPVGALVQGTDGSLYGVTELNKLRTFQLYGTAFKISTSGKLTTLYAFNFSDGAYPYAGMIQGTDGNFYGTTYGGVNSANGSVYRLTPSGALTTLLSFDGFNDGAHPESALVEAQDHALYGTAITGGPGGGGTIFRLAFTDAPQITSQPVSLAVAAGTSAKLSVAVSGAPLLAYQWMKNGTILSDNGKTSGSTARVLLINDTALDDAGIYSVTIANSLGTTNSTGATLTVVPRPTFQTAISTNGSMKLEWSATLGQKYQLQYNTNLNPTNWSNLGSAITATNLAITILDPLNPSGRRFYRVLLVL